MKNLQILVMVSDFPKIIVLKLCYYCLGRYFVLTASDLEELYQNPESFHHEQDMVQWTEKLRPCAEALYIVLFENHSQVGGVFLFYNFLSINLLLLVLVHKLSNYF